MALSFEESKKLLTAQIPDTAAAMPSSVTDTGIMTLDFNNGIGTVAAYSEWTKSSKYDWYDEYTDENISTVDKNKNITVDASQINISQEENSQFIPFEMPRYYDGFDLMSATIWFYYLSSDGVTGASKAVNVSYDTAKIKFGWLVDGQATHTAGSLKFEIRAIGTNSKGNAYVWKTKTFDKMNVLQSLINDRAIKLDDSWVQELVTDIAASVAEQIANIQVADQVAAAESAANRAEAAATNAESTVKNVLVNYYTKTEVDEAVANVKVDLTGYATESYVQDQIDAIPDVDLSGYALKTEIPTNVSALTNDAGYLTEHQSLDGLATETYVQEEIAKVDVSDQLVDYAKSEDVYTKTEIDNAIANVEVDLSGYYTKTEIDSQVNTLSSSVGTNTTNITSLSSTVGSLQAVVNNIDTSPKLTYDVKYNDIEDVDVGENVFAFYEITNEGKENEVRELKKKFTIVGGSGGGSGSSLKISYVTTSPVIATVNDKVLIKYNFSGTDSSGDIVSEGNYTWKIGNKVIASGIATYGENTFDVTNFATTTSQKFVLSITDDAGSLVTKSWTVQKVDLRLESTFSDAYPYSGNVSFSYTPYGAVEKEIHFVLDGTEIGVVKTSASGVPAPYTIPAQSHGAHLLEAYMTAKINNQTIGLEEIINEESGEVVGYNHTIKILKDILWQDAESDIPIIGCATQNINVTQYNNVNIKYVVLDPNTETPRVTWSVDDKVISEETLTEKDDYGYYTFPYKANTSGTFVLTVSCGDAEPKKITVNVEELNIPVSPVTAGLEFDFNPVGYSNNSADRLWSDNNITMTVSENFDWVNGGYQIDENGDQYFCVKAGTNAVINYNLFADDPKKTGKEFKVIFRTKNIRKRDTSFLTCIDSGIGLDMKVENATVYNSGGHLKSDYCEDTIIEYEFNINKDTDMMIVMSYEDGAPSKPYEYTETSSFKQTSPKPITIGSKDCDIFIYRMKAYSISLTDTDIKNNFIADARNAEEIIARYNRNNIYNTDGKLISTSASGDFSVDALMKAAPDLRYIFLEVPQFTNDKDNKIDGCTVHFRYPAGTRPQDNWTCTGMRHRGQGTSSNLYGYSGRNIDLCMDRSSSLFTWIDEEGKTVESRTITLTDTSVPTDYLNIKVNIASSENANNAQLARRFNEYQPFLRYARKKDSKVKDTMEFYNCVVFIRETSTDMSEHREFNDTDWHFYAIGNIGDSKKTDDTRVNNASDPKEHIIEISDADKPLSAFPTGKDGHAICPVGEWRDGNTAYDILHSTEYVYDEEGAFESFGGETFEFRYEMDGITAEQREANINAWRDLYKFIVTSTDEEFYANLKNYFVVDSALYFYLFTERYTMVDNRAKNSFWHYGKVYISESEAAELGETEASYYIIDNAAAAVNDGYRYDLTQGYDMDTALGIDNTGDYVFSYGKEDTDYYVDGDPTSDYVFRVADSVFFCRLRDLFPSELQAMFKNREEKNAWSSTSLINQWDNAQAQFPEELWRLDYERKYYRTYLGLSIDNSINTGEGRGVDKSFLNGKFFGRKKYARRAFETNQEIYFATKYFGNKALSDVFWIRGNVPIGGSIKPNYSLTLVPYSNMYVCVQYTSTGTPIHKKVKAGETVHFESSAERMDFIYVYAASFIQEVGDLSRCFVGDNNFSSATRLQKLVIGSTDAGYENTFMKEVLVANNTLLEYLDLRNISGINTVINVSGCSNLKELYAEGTNATGVIFANGGLLQTAHLPSLTSLSMKNLNYIKDFVIDGYDNLQTLIVENVSNINTYSIVTNAPSLKLLRLINLNWNFVPSIEDGSIFDRLLTIGGIDSSGYEIDMSVLTGNAHVAIMKERQLYNYQEAWHDLDVTYNTLINQYAVTFVNTDGTVLDVQYVDKGQKPVDPIGRVNNPIAVPTIASTVSTDYTFAGWDSEFITVFENMVFKAIYTETVRTYTVKYTSNGITLQETVAPYGTSVWYSGDIPTYTAEEGAYKYYLFDGWDKSGYVNGDKIINAVFDSCEYSAGYFDGKELSDMRPVEIYALTKLGLESNHVDSKDIITVTLGSDISYSDVEEQVLIAEPVVFNGHNKVDTNVKLLGEDRDFVLAIDYLIDNTSPNGSMFAECYSDNGMSGFRLWCNSGVKLSWGTSTTTPTSTNRREMLVLRHVKGENGLHVYTSNTSDATTGYIELNGLHSMMHDGTLVFGCSKADDGTTYENYAHGTVYWSKVWYADLGDDICSNLAYWPHEEMNFEMCGFKRYYLSDGSSKRSAMSFLSSGVLSSKSTYGGTNNSKNAGGWANSPLNVYLNNRIYAAFPIKWKQLMKQVQVKSSVGNKSMEVSKSDCYIYIPALYELDASRSTEPYFSEVYPSTTIDYMLSNTHRICKDDSGTAVSYWTRSPNHANDYGIHVITAGGDVSSFNYPYAEHHVRIMFSI